MRRRRKTTTRRSPAHEPPSSLSRRVTDACTRCTRRTSCMKTLGACRECSVGTVVSATNSGSVTCPRGLHSPGGGRRSPFLKAGKLYAKWSFLTAASQCRQCPVGTVVSQPRCRALRMNYLPQWPVCKRRQRAVQVPAGILYHEQLSVKP